MVDKLISDSTLLMTMKEEEEEILSEELKLEKLNLCFEDKRKNIIKRVYPIYQGVYPTNTEELFQSIEDLHYLDCSKRKELLILLLFREDKDTILDKLNENIIQEYSIILKAENIKTDIIAYNMIDLLKSENYIFDYNDLVIACINGNLEVAKYIFETTKIDNIHELFVIILNRCTLNTFEVLKWIWEVNIDGENGKIDFHKGDDLIFQRMFSTKQFKIIEWWWNLSLQPDIGPINIQSENFQEDVCRTGNLEIVEWMFNVFLQKNIKIDDIDRLFFRICLSGDLDVVRWMWNFSLREDIGGINLEMCSSILEILCKDGKLDVAEFIFNIKTKDSDMSLLIYSLDITEILFENSCKSGNVKMVKWVLKTFNKWGMDISKDNYKILNNAFQHIDLFKFLLHISYKENSKMITRHIREDNNYILRSLMSGDPKLVKLILKFGGQVDDNKITTFFQQIILVPPNVQKDLDFVAIGKILRLIKFVYTTSIDFHLGGKIDLTKIDTNGTIKEIQQYIESLSSI